MAASLQRACLSTSKQAGERFTPIILRVHTCCGTGNSYEPEQHYTRKTGRPFQRQGTTTLVPEGSQDRSFERTGYYQHFSKRPILLKWLLRYLRTDKKPLVSNAQQWSSSLKIPAKHPTQTGFVLMVISVHYRFTGQIFKGVSQSVKPGLPPDLGILKTPCECRYPVVPSVDLRPPKWYHVDAQRAYNPPGTSRTHSASGRMPIFLGGL